MPRYYLTKSPLKDKRFRIYMKDHHHDFGSKGGSTYIDHGDDKIKKAWHARHKTNPNYNQFHSAINMSRTLLWGKHKSLDKNIKDFNTTYDVHIIKKL
jgi:hypothetical protein